MTAAKGRGTNNKAWNFAIAIAMLVVFLALAILGSITADTFYALASATVGAVTGTVVTRVGIKLLKKPQFPQPTIEQAAVVALFIIFVVATLAGVLSEQRLLEFSLFLLAYTLGRA